MQWIFQNNIWPLRFIKVTLMSQNQHQNLRYFQFWILASILRSLGMFLWIFLSLFCFLVSKLKFRSAWEHNCTRSIEVKVYLVSQLVCVKVSPFCTILFLKGKEKKIVYWQKEQKGIVFDHNFGYSFPLFSKKSWSKNNAFLLAYLVRVKQLCKANKVESQNFLDPVLA